MAELSLVVKATVVLAVALAVARAARRAPAAVRALVLASAFGVLLLLPIAAMLVQPRAVVIPVEISVAEVSALLPVPAEGATTFEPARPAEGVGDPARQPWRLPLPPLSSALRVTWGLAAIMFAARLGIALIRLRIMRRRALPWPAGRPLVDAIAEEAGVRRPIGLFLHDGLPAPVTYGMMHPSVGLPSDAPEWTATELRHALIHEVEHVRRGDWAVQLLARSACVIYWFHPLVWIAWRRLCIESERACDDAVVRAAERTAYAEQLVSLARRLKSSPAPLLSMADRSDLATRVDAVLNAAQARGPVGAVTVLWILCAAIGLAAAISPLQAVQGAAAQLPSADARRLAFEVASIRVSESTDGPRGILPTPGGRFTALGLPLRDLFALAHGAAPLTEDQIVGAPDWMSTVRFDIIATEDPAAAPQMPIQDRMYAMLRTLLADRFGLRFRRESRDLPVFDLVMASERRTMGPRLRPTAADCEALSRNPMTGCGFRRVAPGLITGEGLEMGSLASTLSRQPGVGRVVRDRTGLQGRFDLRLEFAPEALAADATPPQADPAGAKPTLFTALQEQLGLRLEVARGPVEVFVIENVRQPPPDDGLPSAPQPQASSAPDRFEVVSIRRNRSTEPARGRIEPGGRFTAINVPVAQIITQAYGVRRFQVLNAPDWTASERFDITAKTPEGVPFGGGAVAPFLRGLLRDRFAFSARTEAHDMPIYALVTSRPDRKPGPKLGSSAVDCTGPMPAPAAGRPQSDRPLCAMLGQLIGSNNRRYEMRGYPMATFAQMLAGAVDRFVVDRTGLAGSWNLELDFAAEAVNPAPDDLPSIFTALQEQLALKLEPDRGPVDMLVIASIERPTED
jgi:uncharacterized protein (TIGR03435 family)